MPQILLNDKTYLSLAQVVSQKCHYKTLQFQRPGMFIPIIRKYGNDVISKSRV